MNTKQVCGLIVALSVAAVCARADSLELKNGSLINGKFVGGTQTEHQLSGRIVGAKLWCRRYPFAPIRFRCAGYLAFCSLKAAEFSSRDRRR